MNERGQPVTNGPLITSGDSYIDATGVYVRAAWASTVRERQCIDQKALLYTPRPGNAARVL